MFFVVLNVVVGVIVVSVVVVIAVVVISVVFDAVVVANVVVVVEVVWICSEVNDKVVSAAIKFSLGGEIDAIPFAVFEFFVGSAIE